MSSAEDEVIKVGPTPICLVSLQEEPFEQIHRRITYNNRDREWSDASQAWMPRIGDQ